MSTGLRLGEYAVTPLYNIKAVVQATGISPSTLRAWERRYNIARPQRSDSGYRLYSERDVAVIRWLKAQTDAGMSISQAVSWLGNLINDTGAVEQTTLPTTAGGAPLHDPLGALPGSHRAAESWRGFRWFSVSAPVRARLAGSVTSGMPTISTRAARSRMVDRGWQGGSVVVVTAAAGWDSPTLGKKKRTGAETTSPGVAPVAAPAAAGERRAHSADCGVAADRFAEPAEPVRGLVATLGRPAPVSLRV